MCDNDHRGTRSLYSGLDIVSLWDGTFCISAPSSRIGEENGRDDTMKVN